MKTIKQILTLLLALTVVLGMAISANAATIVASGTCGENLTWTLDSEGILTISGTGPMEYTPTAGASPWYSYREFIESVVIEKGVTSIEDSAFEDCSSLTDISIPEGVTSIGDSAFIQCRSLTGITIPGSVTSIGHSAFWCCSSITNIVIPDGVTSIEDTTFYYCSGLTSVAIPEGVTSIGEQAFWGCSSLTNITIPQSVKSIGIYAFYNCSSLEAVIIPDGVTRIGDYTFYNCSSLVSASIPDSVTRIGEFAFWNCGNLADITIPQGVTKIGVAAFCNCSSLTSITIPDSVSRIDHCAFQDCKNLTKVTFQGDAPSISYNAFQRVTATAYYPEDNATWTANTLQNYGGTITWVAYSKIPKPNKIVNVVSGVHVYWNAVDGAAKYGLWRSETGVNGTYKWVANPTVPHFTDTKVESGKTYYYKVTTMDSKGNHSIKSDAIGITYVSTPDISARYNKAAGVKLDWKKVTGATGYAIYRKSYSGNDTWVRVATISGNSTFTWTDTSVKNNNGTAYKYTIRALAGSNMKTLSGCRNAGRSMVRLTSRTLTGAAKASATSIKCSWNTTSAATGYEVRFIVDGVVYKTFTVGDYKIGVKTFTGLQAGQTYKIQVRSYKKIDGMCFYSAWSTAKTVTL